MHLEPVQCLYPSRHLYDTSLRWYQLWLCGLSADMQHNGRQYFDVKLAVDTANEIDFDLILLAIHMPVTGGLSAAKAIRENLQMRPR